jgi:hypothetical protein
MSSDGVQETDRNNRIHEMDNEWTTVNKRKGIRNVSAIDRSF